MTKTDLNGYAMRISQASKTEIIVIMYEVAIKYIEDGIKALEEGDKEQFRHDVKKAKAFINELSTSLDMKYGVSNELFRLYTFMSNVMVKAGISLETEELLRVKEMLKKLLAAFSEVSEQDNSGPVMRNTQQIYSGLTYSKNALNETYGSVQDIRRGYKV